MGRITGGLHTSITGNVGGLVFVQMNGETYVRTRPQRQKNSWTEKQLLNQKRFQLISQYCIAFKKTLIPQIWNPAAEGLKYSGYHLFLKNNMPAFGADGTLADATKLRFSEGKLPLPYHLQVSRNSDDQRLIEITWENDPKIQRARLSDQLMLIAGINGVASAPIVTGSTRAAGSTTWQIPEAAAEPTEVYLYFAAADGKSFSPDQCFQL